MPDIEKLLENPFSKANVLSKLFFWWLNGFFWKGSKRSLDMKDLYEPLKNDTSKVLGDKLSKNWKKEIERCRKLNAKKTSSSKPHVPSLWKAIIKTFAVKYMLVGILAFIEECFTRIGQPLCLGLLIRYFTNPAEFSKNDGFYIAAGVVFGSIFYTFTHHPYFFGVQHTGMQIRIACCSMVYRKAMKLTQGSLGQTTIGQMVNLLSNDVNRFDQATIFMHYLWVGPIQTTIVTIILWLYFGPSCLAGLSVSLLFIPFQGYMGKLFSSLRSSTAVKTDKRIRVMNEVIGGMRVIKMYTWEKPFSKLVNESREDEIKVVRKTSHLRALNMSLFYTSSKVIIFLTLLTYVLLGHQLTAEKVFVTLALYNNVRLVMTLFFPNAVAQLAESSVSVSRLQKFLLMEEREPKVHTKLKPENKEKISSSSASLRQKPIELKNFTARWNSNVTEDTLSNINLSVEHKELVALIGPVGCGKGSLLQAIMEELPPREGSVNVTGSVAYTAQEAWVFAGSVRENITFGRAFDEKWYEQVVEACALTRDFEIFPYGDSTLVGDRGTSLSGGQKARITLARAVYADADIYLLDDPLSAVDAEVGRHLFEKCISGLLANKTRILVTHQLQFLRNLKHIVLLNEGKIQIKGDYSKLVSSNIDFTQLLLTEQEREEKAEGDVKVENSDIASDHKSKIRHRAFSTSSRSSRLSLKRDSIALNEGTLSGHMFSVENLVVSDDEEVSELEIPAKSEPPTQMEESRASGKVRWSLYYRYFKAGSNACTFGMMVFANLATQICFTGSDWWLNFWAQAEENGVRGVRIDDPLYDLYNERNLQIYIYSGIIGALFIFSLWRTMMFFWICMNASVNLHNSMFKGIIRAPMQFFEMNPIGRILNRISRDFGNIDDLLPVTMYDVFEIFLNVAGIICIVALVNPILMAPACILMIFFYLLRNYYLKTARSVKRLEGVSRSPVFSHLSTSLYGLTTIRAFNVEQEFCQRFDALQDMHTSSWFMFIATTRWFGVCLDWLSASFIAVVTFSFMFFTAYGAEVGLAVSSAMTLSGMFQWGVRQSAEVENQMVSVERVLEYTKIEPEAQLESSEDRRPPKEWPDKGKIMLKKMSLKYGDNVVLRNITCTFQPNEKIGVVGRTGAGKSTLITALFRLVEPSSGEIIIDGVDVLKIGLHDLRSKISIIPQDPVLFNGTIRKNLDPFDDYNDSEIWRILDEVHLSGEIKQNPEGLNSQVAEGGSNFSVGQRQLVCLGRAILRKNRILVLDEATANVDPETDALIQNTIRDKFLKCTVITIAHRLHTVMDSDKILVLDAGNIEEFDEPYKLLRNPDSMLSKLVAQTGKSTAETLERIAREASEARKSPLE